MAIDPTREILAMRLFRQRLSDPAGSDPKEVVAALTAVQAQDFPAAKWSLALRMENPSERGIEESYDRGDILRVHVLRPTWHFVTPADIRWMIELSAPRVKKMMSPYNKKVELDGALFAKCNTAIERSLRGGHHLTRREIKATLERIGVATNVQRLAHIVMEAELDGLVCSGPMRGKQHTYALLEERVPRARRPSREEALAGLAFRYFSSHGPAQLKDFAWWSGLSARDAEAALDSIKGKLDEIEVRGKTYRFKSGGKPPPEAPAALLLSMYDEYTIAYADRSDVSADRDIERMISWGNALTAVIVLGGKAAGGWKKRLVKNGIEVELKPFRKLSRDERAAVRVQVDRYGDFLGRKASMKT